ncbi:hypothetical protein F511_46763 [Dorcoceras hygrometricum]|uniref:Uncharacterized protein n=1 Tax=Dorcoceras hygrometricum TaxID=472368 RepID=A0A2Z6ZZG6_9LAMI|nr:hypothetical protein F511_46763 [Dorcoceras hygrometricum]
MSTWRRYSPQERMNRGRHLGLGRDARVEKPQPRPVRQEPPLLLGEFTARTPLKVSKARALEICDERKVVQRPRGSDGAPRNPNSDKFCDFHRDYGHTTAECRLWDQELERIIQNNPNVRTALVAVKPRRWEKRPRREDDRQFNNRASFQDRTPRVQDL